MNSNCGFLKFLFGNQFGEKNQNNSDTTQICFESFNLFKVQYDIYLNWEFIIDKFQLGHRFREKSK